MTPLPFIQLESIPNIRDLGGYPVADGRIIKSGMILRGGALDKVSDEDAATLRDKFKLKHIVDLRGRMEIARGEDRAIGGASYVNIDLIDYSHAGPSIESLFARGFKSIEDIMVNGAMDPYVQLVISNLYTTFVSSRHTLDGYSTLMRLLVEADDNGAFYFHCSQGKDRTGLGAAFILSALGATRDLIIADFSCSKDAYYEPTGRIIEQIRRKGGDDAAVGVAQAMSSVNVEYFREALGYIDIHYGGMDAFLHERLLLTDADIRTLQDRYLEKI